MLGLGRSVERSRALCRPRLLALSAGRSSVALVQRAPDRETPRRSRRCERERGREEASRRVREILGKIARRDDMQVTTMRTGGVVGPVMVARGRATTRAQEIGVEFHRVAVKKRTPRYSERFNKAEAQMSLIEDRLGPAGSANSTRLRLHGHALEHRKGIEHHIAFNLNLRLLHNAFDGQEAFLLVAGRQSLDASHCFSLASTRFACLSNAPSIDCAWRLTAASVVFTARFRAASSSVTSSSTVTAATRCSYRCNLSASSPLGFRGWGRALSFRSD